MCLIVLAWKTHRRYPLVLATNRDELHARPSTSLGYWRDKPDVLGGRDVEKGGTWLATNTDGRWAAVTNFRDGDPVSAPSRSRGHLVKSFVGSDLPAERYAASIEQSLPEYAGCNLLIGGSEGLFYASNRHESAPSSRIQTVAPGIHGLSNHLLDTPWPKVERCKQHMETLLDSEGEAITHSLFELLADRSLANDSELPSTGVSLEREHALSAPLIVADSYGTRASTVLLMDNEGTIEMHERVFGANGAESGRCSFSFSRRAAVIS